MSPSEQIDGNVIKAALDVQEMRFGPTKEEMPMPSMLRPIKISDTGKSLYLSVNGLIGISQVIRRQSAGLGLEALFRNKTHKSLL